MNQELSEQKSKNPYKKPVLVTYGALAELTRTVGANGMNDGGGSPPNKSQP
jgi:hypothetical protein